MLQIKGGGASSLEGQQYRGNCCHCCCCHRHRRCRHRRPCCTSSSPLPSPLLQVAGCCHCHQDNNFFTVFVISHVFLQLQTGDRRHHLCPRTEGDGLGKPKAWEVLMGLPKDLCFHVFFGVSAEVTVEAWEMMADHSCLPPNPEFLHDLWALAFMQMYPANNTALSTLLGGKDPKTV